MRGQNKDIIVPVDFASSSKQVIESALDLQKKVNGNIHLIHVIDFKDWWSNYAINEEIKAKLEELALHKFKELTNQFPGTNFITALLFGKVYKQILEYAENQKTRFILMYDKHKDDTQNKILGSTLTHVITESKYPVITFKNTHTEILKKIVIPLDLTRKIKFQLFSAIALSMHYDAKLHIVSVVFDNKGNMNSRVEGQLQKVKKTLDENNLDYSIEIIPKVKAFAYQEILEASEKADADMIVIMTHKESYKFDNYIGAFAHHIINHSKIPVLSVTSEAATPSFDSLMHKFLDPLRIYSDKKD